MVAVEKKSASFLSTCTPRLCNIFYSLIEKFNLECFVPSKRSDFAQTINDLINSIPSISASHYVKFISFLETLFTHTDPLFNETAQVLATCFFKNDCFFVKETTLYTIYKDSIDSSISKTTCSCSLEDTSVNHKRFSNVKKYRILFIQQAVSILKYEKSDQSDKIIFIYNNFSKILSRSTTRSILSYGRIFYELCLKDRCDLSIGISTMRYNAITDFFVNIVTNRLSNLYSIMKSVFIFRYTKIYTDNKPIEELCWSEKTIKLINCLQDTFLKINFAEKHLLFSILEPDIVSLLDRLKNGEVVIDKVLVRQFIEFFKLMLVELKIY